MRKLLPALMSAVLATQFAACSQSPTDDGAAAAIAIRQVPLAAAVHKLDADHARLHAQAPDTTARQITAIEYAGSYNGEATYELTLASAGALTFTAL